MNDVLTRFIASGTLEPKETMPTVAPSMDIQIPSSLERLKTINMFWNYSMVQQNHLKIMHFNRLVQLQIEDWKRSVRED